MDIKLYEISDAYRQAVAYMEQYAEENDGLIPDDLAEKIEELEGTYQEKLVSCAHVYKNFMAEAEAIKAEEKKLSERRKQAENKAESVKGLIARYLKEGDSVKTSTVVLSWKESSSVEVKDASKLPFQYQRVSIEPDKVELKKALKSGETFEGVTLVTKQNLQIK